MSAGCSRVRLDGPRLRSILKEEPTIRRPEEGSPRAASRSGDGSGQTRTGGGETEADGDADVVDQKCRVAGVPAKLLPRVSPPLGGEGRRGGGAGKGPTTWRPLSLAAVCRASLWPEDRVEAGRGAEPSAASTPVANGQQVELPLV